MQRRPSPSQPSDQRQLTLTCSCCVSPQSYYFIGPFESGKPLGSGGIGLVKASKADGFAAGDVVSGMLPWSSHAVLDAAAQVGA
jgi:NADPH-dependent curcumin reductase CurA